MLKSHAWNSLICNAPHTRYIYTERQPTMLQAMPVAYKLLLMLLVVVQGGWHKTQVEHSALAGICAAALCVLVACCLPAAVYSVLDREQTAVFLLQTAGQMLATVCAMHYLLRQGDTGHAAVLLQTMLAHVFYCVAMAAHEHRQRHTLPNRQSVRIVCLASMVVFPLVLSLRCAAHPVDLSVALLVMFAADVTHFAVMIATMVVVCLARLYERCFVGE